LSPTKYPQALLSHQKRKLPSINPEALNSQQAAFLSLQKQLAEKNPYWGLEMMADELEFAC
jgi:hypothetical protein